MQIIQPALTHAERTAAKLALQAAAKNHKHVGVRPAEAHPRKTESPGIRLEYTEDADAAIVCARQQWPDITTMSAFGADLYEAAAAESSGALEGAGIFNDCTEYGQFEVPPSVDLTTP